MAGRDNRLHDCPEPSWNRRGAAVLRRFNRNGAGGGCGILSESHFIPYRGHRNFCADADDRIPTWDPGARDHRPCTPGPRSPRSTARRDGARNRARKRPSSGFGHGSGWNWRRFDKIVYPLCGSPKAGRQDHPAWLDGRSGVCISSGVRRGRAMHRWIAQTEAFLWPSILPADGSKAGCLHHNSSATRREPPPDESPSPRPMSTHRGRRP